MAFNQYDRTKNENQKFINVGTDQVAIRVAMDESIATTDYEFFDTDTASYTADGDEANITLNRGTSWIIKEISVYSSKGVADSYVQVFDLAAGSTVNQRDPAHASSNDILHGAFYYSNKQTLTLSPAITFSTGLRLRFNGFGSVAHTVYVTVKYIPV